jgi:hypothetical protein
MHLCVEFRCIWSAGTGHPDITICMFEFCQHTVALSNRRLKEMGVQVMVAMGYARQLLNVLDRCIGSGALFVINNWWLPVFNSMFGSSVQAVH